MNISIKLLLTIVVFGLIIIVINPSNVLARPANDCNTPTTVANLTGGCVSYNNTIASNVVLLNSLKNYNHNAKYIGLLKIFYKS